MTPLLKKYGATVLWTILALAIVGAAWFGKDTQYENAFFYILAVGIILIAVFEMYIKKLK